MSEHYSPDDAYREGYSLGYADGEGSMENINPQAEKWRQIEEMGFQRAASRVLYYHHEVVGICPACEDPWPCDTALIFLPELDTTPAPFDLGPDSPW